MQDNNFFSQMSSAPHTPSPTGSSGCMAGPLESGVTNVNEKSEQCTIVKDVVYSTESEAHTPTKEEIETNEKNLQQSASYLGQLVFKLRYALLIC